MWSIKNIVTLWALAFCLSTNAQETDDVRLNSLFERLDAKAIVSNIPMESPFAISLQNNIHLYPVETYLLFQDANHDWSFYYTLKFRSETKQFRIHDSICRTLAFDHLEALVDSLNEVVLISQEEIDIDQDFFRSLQDGMQRTIVISKEGQVKTLRYNNPNAYLQLLKKKNYSTIEHETFILLTSSIYDSLIKLNTPVDYFSLLRKRELQKRLQKD